MGNKCWPIKYLYLHKNMGATKHFPLSCQIVMKESERIGIHEDNYFAHILIPSNLIMTLMSVI